MNSLNFYNNMLGESSIKNTSICIVTPIWKNKLSKSELKKLKFSLMLNSEYDHFFVCPNNLNSTFYKKHFKKSKFISFEKKFFVNIKGYNILMQSYFFYEKFIDYDKMLILQTDALLVKNIKPIIETNFDYVAAPWECGLVIPQFLFKNKYLSIILKKIGFKTTCYVGNGGLSLRNISKFICVCRDYPIISWLNEDMKFALLGEKGILSLGHIDFCKKIFFEKSEVEIDKLPDVIGYHAIEKYYPKLYLNYFKS